METFIYCKVFSVGLQPASTMEILSDESITPYSISLSTAASGSRGGIVDKWFMVIPFSGLLPSSRCHDGSHVTYL